MIPYRDTNGEEGKLILAWFTNSEIAEIGGSETLWNSDSWETAMRVLTWKIHYIPKKTLDSFDSYRWDVIIEKPADGIKDAADFVLGELARIYPPQTIIKRT